MLTFLVFLSILYFKFEKSIRQFLASIAQQVEQLICNQ